MKILSANVLSLLKSHPTRLLHLRRIIQILLSIILAFLLTPIIVTFPFVIFLGALYPLIFTALVICMYFCFGWEMTTYQNNRNNSVTGILKSFSPTKRYFLILVCSVFSFIFTLFSLVMMMRAYGTFGWFFVYGDNDTLTNQYSFILFIPLFAIPFLVVAGYGTFQYAFASLMNKKLLDCKQRTVSILVFSLCFIRIFTLLLLDS